MQVDGVGDQLYVEVQGKGNKPSLGAFEREEHGEC